MYLTGLFFLLQWLLLVLRLSHETHTVFIFYRWAWNQFDSFLFSFPLRQFYLHRRKYILCHITRFYLLSLCMWVCVWTFAKCMQTTSIHWLNFFPLVDYFRFDGYFNLYNCFFQFNFFHINYTDSYMYLKRKRECVCMWLSLYRDMHVRHHRKQHNKPTTKKFVHKKNEAPLFRVFSVVFSLHF